MTGGEGESEGGEHTSKHTDQHNGNKKKPSQQRTAVTSVAERAQPARRRGESEEAAIHNNVQPVFFLSNVELACRNTV